MYIFLPKTEGHKHFSGRHSQEIQFFTENVCMFAMGDERKYCADDSSGYMILCEFCGPDSVWPAG